MFLSFLNWGKFWVSLFWKNLLNLECENVAPWCIEDLISLQQNNCMKQTFNHGKSIKYAFGYLKNQAERFTTFFKKLPYFLSILFCETPCSWVVFVVERKGIFMTTGFGTSALIDDWHLKARRSRNIWKVSTILWNR